MIKVTGLTKIYSSGGQSLKALDNVSFTLSDKGLVFIVGKSGSGKSTLINMLGGLDDITEGDVCIDDFKLSKANTFQLDKFRNNYLGIIYQNYNLFENESIEDNIKIGSDVSENKTTPEQLDEILKDIDLEKKKSELVKNLSGGQKQRVAIARALIKNPELILADEPTGNLDIRTAKTIFSLLKKASKDRLVIVITHDYPSALKYADRILELADGKIVQDRVRNTKDRSTSIKYFELDTNQNVSSEELNEINESIKDSKAKLVKKDEHFISNGEEQIISEQKYSAKHQKYRKVFKNGIKLLKENKVSFIISSILMMLVIGLMSISSSFINFDGAATIRDVTNKYDIKNLVIRKSYSETGRAVDTWKSRHIRVREKDVELLEQVGYEGKKYDLYTCSGSLDGEVWTAKSTGDIKYKNFYAEGISGVIKCDKEYMAKMFGNVEVLAGSIYGLEGTGKIIITDFIADSMLFHKPSWKSPDEDDPYATIMEKTYSSGFKVGAIIKTDYKEKYSAFMDTVQRIQREPQHASQLRKAVVESDLFGQFLSDANSYLNFGYSLDPDYEHSVAEAIGVMYFYQSAYQTEENGRLTVLETYQDCRVSSKLEGHNVKMVLDVYNKIFGKNLSSTSDPEFEEKDIWITKYSEEDPRGDIFYDKVKLHVVGVYTTGNAHDIFQISRDLLREKIDYDQFVTGWVFDNAQQCYDLYSKLYYHYYFNYNECFRSVFETIDTILIFSEIFEILFYVFLGILALIIVMHNLRLVKQEQYRFGVMKSLGYNNLYLTLVTMVLNILSVVAVFALSTLFSWAAGLGINRIIQFGFAKYFESNLYYGITMIAFDFKAVGLYTLIVLGIMVVSSFVPLLAIRNIKPSKIIRNAE